MHAKVEMVVHDHVCAYIDPAELRRPVQQVEEASLDTFVPQQELLVRDAVYHVIVPFA
jgi:hypothetical protein